MISFVKCDLEFEVSSRGIHALLGDAVNFSDTSGTGARENRQIEEVLRRVEARRESYSGIKTNVGGSSVCTTYFSIRGLGQVPGPEFTVTLARSTV
jgi:hypothetical protein